MILYLALNCQTFFLLFYSQLMKFPFIYDVLFLLSATIKNILQVYIKLTIQLKRSWQTPESQHHWHIHTNIEKTKYITSNLEVNIIVIVIFLKQSHYHSFKTLGNLKIYKFIYLKILTTQSSLNEKIFPEKISSQLKFYTHHCQTTNFGRIDILNDHCDHPTLRTIGHHRRAILQQKSPSSPILTVLEQLHPSSPNIDRNDILGIGLLGYFDQRGATVIAFQNHITHSSEGLSQHFPMYSYPFTIDHLRIEGEIQLV